MANTFRKLYLLIWKNFILQIRRPIGTVVEIVLPLGFLALLILARQKIDRKEKCMEVFDKVDIWNESTSLFDYRQKIIKEKKLNISKTLFWKLGYFPNDQKTKTLLELGLQNSKIPIKLADKSSDNKPFTSLKLDEIIKDAKEHRDKYIGVLVFKNVANGTNSWPKKIEYTIRLHHSTGALYVNRGRSWFTKQVFPEYIRPGAAKRKLYESPFITLQFIVDSAIMRHHKNDINLNAAQYTQQFPYPDYTSDPFVDMVAFLIPLMMVLSFIYTAQMVVKEIVSEKEFRLTESMKMMGLPGWIHWLAWFIKVFAGFLLIIILQTLILKGGKIFEFSHGGVIFLTLFLWVLASIFFLFLISAFCSIGTRGMLAASTLWFGSFAPYLGIQNPSTYDNLSMQAKRGCCILPNTCLGIMTKTILRYEGEQIGVNWDNINKPVTVDENFSLSNAFGMLVFDCILFSFLTFYISNVFPGEYGIPKPFYFLFQPSYWCPNKNIKMKDADVEMSCGQDNFEEEPNLEVGIHIKNLRKVFKSSVGKKVAVNDLSLKMFKGQITALLGHNGAGKTTTLSILTGLFPPSCGDATLGGRSILTDMDSIRDSLGLCPQHNVLFDRLTVKEHLEFFAALKGTPKGKAVEEIRQLLSDIQLLDKADERSATLSGGMKRKLSCAVALVGGSETVILDEPTSGMDPYARRATWDLLQRYRGNKTIIITTHYMDEADYLGDRIAIMSEGTMKCCGSSLFLKKRYGVGYHLTLVKSSEFNENKTSSLVIEKIPTAKMVGNVAAEMSYILQEDTSKSFQGLFQALEEDKGTYGITSFGVSVTTLEEVFLKVGEGETISTEQIENTGEKSLLHDRKDDLHTKDYKLQTSFGLRASQFKAMFLKRFLNSKRQKKALITQIVIPIGLLLLGFILSTAQSTQQDDPLRKLSLNMLKEEDVDLIGFHSDTSKTAALEKKSLADFASSFLSSTKVQLQDVSVSIVNLLNGNMGDNISVLYSKNPYTGKILNGNKSFCCNYQYMALNDQCSNMAGLCTDQKCKLMPIKNTSYLQEYVLEDSAKKIKKYFKQKVIGMTIDDRSISPVVWYSNQAFHTLPSAYSAVNNILLQNALNDSSYGIETTNHPLPRNTQEKSDLSLQNWSNFTLMIFLLFSSCQLAASFITFLIDEKTSKAKHVQFVSGVNTWTYWGATYCWDLLNFIVPAVGIILLFIIFDTTDYDGELGSVFAVTLLFGISILPFVYFLSFFFTSSMSGYGFLAVLVELLSLGMYLAVTILELVDEKELARVMHYVFLIFPTYAYPMALNDLQKNHANRVNCKKDILSQQYCERQAQIVGNPLYQDYTFALTRPAIGYHCLYMFLSAIVYMIIVFLMESNFFLGQLLNSGNNKVFASDAQEDEDVVQEKKKIHSLQVSDFSKSALVVKDLTKVYRTSGMVAVDHLNLEIPKGECFGLLGINGAGKTTTFGMLTGDLSITEGKAYLHGYDLQTQLKYVQQLIGYCPQFDALVGTMTGREMLCMFAQLRGISGNMVDDVVNNAIDQLNLKGWADKLCGTYSGGNKRKLSTAIALVGNPSVVFLDEPTSGMDPASRRHLWNTLSDVLTTGKSIVLTSHSMEECEALCTRLVIMVNGKFKCIGSIQHLKSRFGQGYTVMLKISPKAVNNTTTTGVNNTGFVGDNMEGSPIYKLKSFMNTNFPGAILREEHQGLLQYQVIDRSIKLSQMFGILEENVEILGLSDYSVCQTSLEQVFVNFAKEQHSEDRIKQKTCCSCRFF